jgi:hypothetical protein
VVRSGLVVPPRIARLPHAGALPVPWNTQWEGADTSTRIELTDRGRTMVCTCRPGRGTPAFGQPCPQRQRRAVTDRLCSVCGTPIKRTSRCAFMVAPGPVGVLLEPPTHPRCLSFALGACPVLSRAQDDGLVLTAREYVIVEHRAIGVDEDGEVVHQVFEGRSSVGVLDLLGVIPKEAVFTAIPAWLAAKSS